MKDSYPCVLPYLPLFQTVLREVSTFNYLTTIYLFQMYHGDRKSVV